MEFKKYFVVKNQPTKAPVIGTLVWYLCLDKWGANDIAWGVFYTLFSIIWLFVIMALCLEEKVDLFDKSEPKANVKKSFQQKINEAMENAKKENGLS